MTLVIDIGNARLKWARADGEMLSDSGSALHVNDHEEALAALGGAVRGPVARIVVANVAGDVIAARLVTFALEHWGVEPEFVRTEAEAHGVRCAYADPWRLGVDRWVAVIAAHRRVSGAACVISAGTAVTFDAVDGSGMHLGGLIMPGPRIVADALSVGTRNIGHTEAGAPRRPEGLALLGRSTGEAVRHGAMLALSAAVDRAVATVAEALGGPPTVLLTGGDGPVLEPWLETHVQYHADLVLEGLAYIAAQP